MANANSPYIAKSSNALVNPTTSTVFTQVVPSTVTTPVAAYVKAEGFSAPGGSGVSNNQNIMVFNVTAAGRVTGGGTTNFYPTLLFGKSTTYGSNTVIGGLTAAAFNSTSGNFLIRARLVWDPVSGQINGTVEGMSGSGGAMTLTSPSAITPITGQTVVAPASSVSAPASPGNKEFFFCVAGLFSAGNAGNIVWLDQFQVTTE